MYRCMKCSKEIDLGANELRRIRCPYCGYKILAKERPNIVKTVIAR